MSRVARANSKDFGIYGEWQKRPSAAKVYSERQTKIWAERKAAGVLTKSQERKRKRDMEQEQQQKVQKQERKRQSASILEKAAAQAEKARRAAVRYEASALRAEEASKLAVDAKHAVEDLMNRRLS